MNIYQFIASIFQSLISLAWPMAVVLIAWMFRGKITEMLPLLRLKYKDLDVNFRLDQAEREAKAIKVPELDATPTPEESNKFRELVTISPVSAVLERSRELESAVEAYADAQGMPVPTNRSFLSLTRELRRNGLIDEATSAVLDDLRAVRNSAAHGRGNDISELDAKRFAEIANKAIAQLNIATEAAKQLRGSLPPRKSPSA